MSVLALDLNDASLSVLGDEGFLYREPGYALLDDDRLTTGDMAYRQARVRPRHIYDRFWSELSVDALPDNRFRHLSAADLASRQLEQIWSAVQGHGDRVVVAVPAYMDPARLSLFLGICNDLDIPVAGMVDAAVASTRREYVNAVPVHVDVSLHSTSLTRLAQPGGAQLERSALVESAGLATLYDAWIRVIAESFVRQSRFDPLHTAETEQLLFDRLPDWLVQAGSGSNAELRIEHRGLTHVAAVDVLTLVAAAAPVYQRIVGQLRALFRAEDVPALQLTDRAARLPGLADMLKARVGGEVFLLEPGATARGLLARSRRLTADDGKVSLIRALPWDQAPVEFDTLKPGDVHGRPTHILFGNHAFQLSSTAISLGTQAAAGERWIELPQGMPGLSRRHCSLEIANGQCIVRDYSRFGTFLNGHRLEGSAVLEAGDAIRVGTPGFELRLITVEPDHGS